MILSRFYSNCPEKVFRTGRSAEFFTSEVKKLRRELRSAFNRIKKDVANLEYLKQQRRIAQSRYNKAIRHNQRKILKQAYSSIETPATAARLVKSLVKDPFCSIGTLKLPDGKYTEDAETTLSHLIEYHFPGSSTSVPVSSTPNNILSDIQVAKNIVTKDRIKSAIQSFLPLNVELFLDLDLLINRSQIVMIAQ